MKSYKEMVRLSNAADNYQNSADRTSIHAPAGIKEFYQVRANKCYKKALLLINECDRCQDLGNYMRYGS